MTKNKKKPLRRRRRANRQIDPPTDVVRYLGPLSLPAKDTNTVILVEGATISSGVTGVINPTYNNNMSSARNWTEYSTSWTEYRVLGIKYSYYPLANTPNTTLQTCSGAHSIVHGTISTAPASLAQAFSTGVAKSFNGFMPFTREWRMSTIVEAAFVQTNAPAANSDTLFIYADNATVSQVFGNLMIEYLVQFKTHRL
jgi:hypothetical protein